MYIISALKFITMQKTFAIYVLTKNGFDVAEKIKCSSINVHLFISQKLDTDRKPTNFTTFTSLSTCIEDNFLHYSGHIFICALGIVSRVIAPHIVDKRSDPAVICIDEQGNFVIPVLSGHRGGANKLAQKIAHDLDAIPIITTASEVSNTLSVDTFGDEFSWHLAPNCEHAITHVAATIVNQHKVAIYQDDLPLSCANWRENVSIGSNIHFISDFSELDEQTDKALVVISPRTDLELTAKWQQKCVIWRPNNLILGIGCDKNTPLETLEEGVSLFCQENHLSPLSIHSITSIDLKKNEKGIKALSAKLHISFHTYAPHELDNRQGVQNPSEYVKKITGSNSVAEAAALVESKSCQLLVAKWKYKARGYNMTLACCLDHR